MCLITKSDCMSVTDLNHAVGLLCHVVDVCCKLQKISMTIVFSVSDQLILLIEKL